MNAHTHRSCHFQNKSPTFVVGFVLVDDRLCAVQRDRLPLLLHQELLQVLDAHEARGPGVGRVDDIDLLAVRQQLVEMLDLSTRQIPRFGLVAFLQDLTK